MLTFQGFATPALLASGYTDVPGPEDGFTFVPPTTTCCLPRLPAASHDYLLPPTTTCCFPRLSAAFHGYLLPPPGPSHIPWGIQALDSFFPPAALTSV